MMADEYISREAALKYIKSKQCRTCSDIGLCGNCAVLVAVKLLEKVPAADVAPVVHGKWVHSRYDRSSGQFDVVKCSRCGLEAYAMAYHVRDGNYCPRCGARMDGGNEGE